jgi:MerR family transcriptional regulator, thiopeptide resistance regulator
MPGTVGTTLMDSKNFTVSALAKAAGLSRSTLLYYDRLGLLKPGARSAANYRLYSARDVQRLERICLHRHMGIPLREIGGLLRDSGGGMAAEILRRRLVTLDREIEALRQQQHLITRILNDKKLHKESPMVNKERWVEIMRAAGLTEKDMHNWHVQFEKMEPEAHQEFLESLGIDPADTRKIREWSRTGAAK